MKVKPDKHIHEYLEAFDLGEREVILYLNLLKTGPNTIMNLARETGIKRSTTHNNIEELLRKGLVSQTSYGEKRMVVAEDPEKLKFLMEQKKWDVKKLEDSLSTVIQRIKQLVPESKENNSVQVKYYEGLEGTSSVYREILSAEKVFSFVNVGELAKFFPDNIELFKEALENNRNMEIRDIIEDSQENRAKMKDVHPDRYKYKFAPKNLDLFELDIIIYDESVAIIDLTKEKTTAIVMKFPTLAEGLRSLHKFVWRLLPNV